MEIYLNPGNTSFSKSIRSEIYMDKTGLISFTNNIIPIQAYRDTCPVDWHKLCLKDAIIMPLSGSRYGIDTQMDEQKEMSKK